MRKISILADRARGRPRRPAARAQTFVGVQNGGPTSKKFFQGSRGRGDGFFGLAGFPLRRNAPFRVQHPDSSNSEPRRPASHNPPQGPPGGRAGPDPSSRSPPTLSATTSPPDGDREPPAADRGAPPPHPSPVFYDERAHRRLPQRRNVRSPALVGHSPLRSRPSCERSFPGAGDPDALGTLAVFTLSGTAPEPTTPSSRNIWPAPNDVRTVHRWGSGVARAGR
jgi:hypothetical protein